MSVLLLIKAVCLDKKKSDLHDGNERKCRGWDFAKLHKLLCILLHEFSFYVLLVRC